jgi:serine/threonine protein phosphatase PrpC
VVGGTMRTPIEQTMQLSDGDIVVMYTDGVKSHFAAEDCLWLRTATPSAIAANIVRKFGKSHDDASCLVMRYKR